VPRLLSDGYPHDLIAIVAHCGHWVQLPRPRASLRQALVEAVPTKDQGSAKVGRPCSLAMAAGVTDHVWSLSEVWFYRVQPWPQPQMVYAMVPVDDHSDVWLRCA
jgi:hypothetical protein